MKVPRITLLVNGLARLGVPSPKRQRLKKRSAPCGVLWQVTSSQVFIVV